MFFFQDVVYKHDLETLPGLIFKIITFSRKEHSLVTYSIQGFLDYSDKKLLKIFLENYWQPAMHQKKLFV